MDAPTVAQLKNGKIELEENIKQLIEKFTKLYEVGVYDIIIESAMSGDLLLSIRVKVELHI